MTDNIEQMCPDCGGALTIVQFNYGDETICEECESEWF